ncbi:MAG: hypothetical protein E2577_20685, partial [Starkeya sp.]|nr:hypothetical protein [Starkeya sp.]
PPLTPRTIVSADALRTELARVRATGHAIDDEEIMENLFCVAMPIVMAGIVISTLPVLLIFLFLQKYYVRGVMLSGMK